MYKFIGYVLVFKGKFLFMGLFNSFELIVFLCYVLRFGKLVMEVIKV